MTEMMKTAEKKTPAAPREGAEVSKQEGVTQDACRCKEVAKKTPRELLRVMLNDLAFWKRK